MWGPQHIIFGILFQLLSEKEFFHEIQCDRITNLNGIHDKPNFPENVILKNYTHVIDMNPFWESLVVSFIIMF